MQLSSLFLVPALFALLATEEPAAQTSATPASAISQVQTSSAILQPALDSIQQTLTTLHPEKWKLPSPISQETQANLNSIRGDLQTTLPPLVATADQHPGAIAEALPVFRNISALYDVLLRVTQVAILTAPPPQGTALQQLLIGLEVSKRQLGDALQASASNQNQQIVDLQTQLRTAQAIPAPASPACPPQPAPAPTKKHKAHQTTAPATVPLKPSASPQP